MGRLRLISQLHRNAFGILKDRLKALLEQGPRDCWRIGLLFLPTITALFIVWASGARGLVDLAACAVPFVAQAAVVLRHPFKPRKAVIHPLPVWYFWAVQALCTSSALFLIWRSTALVPAPRNGMLHLLGIAYLLSVASLATTVLPPLLASLEAVAGRLGFPRKVFSASNLYATGLFLAILVLWRMIDEKRLFFFFFVALALPWLIAMLRHRTLWDRKTAVGLAVLPQAGIWLVPLIILLSTATLLPGYAVESFVFTTVGLSCTWALYSLFARLRKWPVKNFTPPNSAKDGDRSAQVKPDPYVKTEVVARLQWLISKSDRGVFGLTGVRGAGKSTLIACTIEQLKDQHFTISMTAPVRYDPGVGFLSSVCRAVCRQVLDDLHPILYGKKKTWTEVLVRVRNFLLTAAFLALAVLAFFAFGPKDTMRLVRRPILTGKLCGDLRLNETTMTEDLLRQVSHIVTRGEQPGGEPLRDLRYRLVPDPAKARFLIVAELPDRNIFLPKVEPIAMYKRVPELSGNQRRELDAWSKLLQVDKKEIPPRHCGTGPASRPIQSLRSFFEKVDAHLMAQGLPRQPAVALIYPHPDWLSFFLLRRTAFGIDTALDFAQLSSFRFLLTAYLNSFQGETLPSQDPTEVLWPGLSLADASRIVIALMIVLLVSVPALRALSTLARALSNLKLVALYREAQQFLELLSYSESLETKGGLTVKALNVERSRSLSARDLTLPGLTARYIEFVQSARRYYNGKLIIAIDELDKVHDPEMVKDLLTEIKGALFSKGCYYLISISDDALTAFRKRLSAGRDIFESTFDDIIAIPQMSVTTASEMIGKYPEEGAEAGRIRLPNSCHFVLALAGGGIPREIIRHLRAVALAHPTGLAELEPETVATEIFCREIREWKEGLADTEVSVEAKILLQTQAEQILYILGTLAFDRLASARVQACLEKCLELIDPAKLRYSTILSSEAGVANETEEIRRYRALIDDMQGCLHLMILTIVCELAWREGEVWKDYEARILEAHRQLTDEPALAETTIGKTRALMASGF
jgi:hypothetical protein